MAHVAWGLAVSMLAFVLFWLRGIAYLYERHPHEDAFILFRYVENVAAGRGIVFNGSGPPAEGATDFLWMILLSLLVRLGVDVAVAVVWLNGLGCALIAYLLFRMWTRGVAVTVDRGIFCVLLAACVPFLAGAHASYDGFSVQLYSGLILLAYCACISHARAAVVAVPYLSLVLGLFRPDGVIVGVGFCLVLLLTRARDPWTRKAFVIHGGIAFLGGLLYFAGRYLYFGELLPLPLYVKSRGGEGMVGAALDIRWFWNGNGPVSLLLVLGLCTVTLLRAYVARACTPASVALGVVRDLLGAVPLWLLFAALAFAHQSQNVDWRFQAPIYTVMLAVMLGAGGRVMRCKPTAGMRVLVPVLCAAAVLPALDEGKKIWPVDYMDSFAIRLGRVLDDQTLVLTEAGRMAYWNTATVHDMVGLNTAYTARQPPSVAYVEGLAPDIVMFHVAGTLRPRRLILLHGDSFREDRVLHVDPSSLYRAVQPSYRDLLSDDPVDYRDALKATKIAPVVLAHYLSQRDDFDVFAVRYGGHFHHIFGVRKDQPFTAVVENELLRAQELGYVSYAEAKGFAPDRLSCRIGAEIASLMGSSVDVRSSEQRCR